MSEQIFKTYLQAIGKGHRSGRTLTQEEAFDAMSLLLAGKVTPEQRGAFLMLLRVREETSEEIAGFLQATRAYNNPKLKQLKIDLDMPCYAGKRRHLPWLILAMLCIVQMGKKVLIHGTDEPDTKRLYVSDALTQLGYNIANSIPEIERSLELRGFAYSDLSFINSQLDDLIKLRAQFGLRSCANTLSRMLNPADAHTSMQGVYHRGLDSKHAKAARLLNERTTAFRGDAGELEVNPERASELLMTQNQETKILTIPAVNENWSIKPRKLDVQLLREVWSGEVVDKYGIGATLSTLSAMLIAMDNSLSFETAANEALELWKHRNRNLLEL
jgi:anthranilate phosphoribosyltransferase